MVTSQAWRTAHGDWRRIRAPLVHGQTEQMDGDARPRAGLPAGDLQGGEDEAADQADQQNDARPPDQYLVGRQEKTIARDVDHSLLKTVSSRYHSKVR